MSAEVELRPLSPETRPVAQQLWQLYRHDLSEFRDSLPDEHARFHERTLVPFFDPGEERAAYLLYRGEIPVGFAFVSRLVTGPILMSEFFVVRGATARHRGRRGRPALRAPSRHVGDPVSGAERRRRPLLATNGGARRARRRTRGAQGGAGQAAHPARCVDHRHGGLTMPLSRRVAHFNRRVTNRLTRHIAWWAPGFAIVTHVGRAPAVRIGRR